ncbi:MAG: methylated-DNA--[protein]-cysteine S-methyltransferase [Clostridiaceae bacterium]|nr:methylated-DNA--[protein]-cysteine S-methyltransferase [Clostridiaceae bacterium]
MLYSCIFQPTPIGPVRLISDEHYIIRLDFYKDSSLEGNEDIVKYLTINYGTDKMSDTCPPILEAAKQQLTEYFAGKRKIFDLPLQLHGTEFQRKCWQALAEIPYGETRSYRQQAEAIGNPKAFRAVGQSNHKNPIAIIVPCHRVIGADGGLCGFGGGLDMKQKLIALEQMYR